MIYDTIIVVESERMAQKLRSLVKENMKVVSVGSALAGVGCEKYLILSLPDARGSQAELERQNEWINSVLKTRVVGK